MHTFSFSVFRINGAQEVWFSNPLYNLVLIYIETRCIFLSYNTIYNRCANSCASQLLTSALCALLVFASIGTLYGCVGMPTFADCACGTRGWCVPKGNGLQLLSKLDLGHGYMSSQKVCVYTCMHTHTIYIHTCTHTYMHDYTHAHNKIIPYAYTQMYTHSHICIHFHPRTYVHAHAPHSHQPVFHNIYTSL